MATVSFAIAQINAIYSAYTEAKDASQEAALSAMSKIAKVLGKELQSNRAILGVNKGTVESGMARWSFADQLVTDRMCHPFRGMLLTTTEYDSKRKESYVTGVSKLSSSQAFMLIFVEALKVVLAKASKLNGGSSVVPDTLGVLVEQEIASMDFNTQTSDAFDYLDGGSQLVLESSYVAVASGSKGLAEMTPALCEQAIPFALELGLVHAFNKGYTFLECDMVYHEEGEVLYAFSSKEAKGVKRVLLPLAQVAQVLGAKNAGWVLPRQRRQIEGAVVKAAFFPTLAFAPGLSMWISGAQNLPTAVIPHHFRGFELSVGSDKECVMSFTNKEAGRDADGNWTVVYFNDVCVESGSVLATFSNGAVLEHFGGEGMLEYIRYQVCSTLSGQRKIVVEYKTITLERVFKGRSIAKAQPVMADASVLYNSLNSGLPEGIDIIHTMDGIKCDVIYSWLLVASTTAVHNQDEELLALISKINEQVTGEAHCNYLYIDPPSVIKGLYEEFLNLFRSKYGRSCWVNFEQCGDMGWMMYQMYALNSPKGWAKVPTYSPLGIEVPAGIELEVYADGDVSDEKTNVLVFAVREGRVLRYWQRAYGYVGVRNLEGFEVSTVQQSVGTSRQLPSYVRSLGRLHGMSLNKQMEIFRSGKGSRLVIKAMHVMLAGKVGSGATEVVDLSAEGGREYLINRLESFGIKYESPEARRSLMSNLSYAFQDSWFQVGEITIWAPVMNYLMGKQLSDTESSTSLPKIFREYILQVLLADEVDHTYYGRRLKGMLNAIMGSLENWKLLSGVKAAMSKRVALPCVPCGEVWVLESASSLSLYAKLKAMGAKDGSLVADNRAPMADGTVSRLRFISQEQNDKLFWQLSEVQVAMSPMACYIDAGDFDGDGQYTCLLPKGTGIVPTSRERVRAIRSDILGIDMFDRECDSYARDHYGIKSFNKIQHGLIKKNVTTKPEFLRRLVGAAIVQQQMVGYSYSLCGLTETLSELAISLDASGLEVPSDLAWALSGDKVVAQAFEQYEVPLGGYSETVFAFWNEVVNPLMNPKTAISPISDKAAFAQCVVAMGGDRRDDAVELQAEACNALADAFSSAAKCHKLTKELSKSEGVCDLETFIYCVALCVFEMARGGNTGLTFVSGVGPRTFKGAQVMDIVAAYHRANRGESWYQGWMAKSSALSSLIEVVLRDVASATTLSNFGNITEEDVQFIKSRAVRKGVMVDLSDVNEGWGVEVESDVEEISPVVVEEVQVQVEEVEVQQVQSEANEVNRSQPAAGGLLTEVAFVDNGSDEAVIGKVVTIVAMMADDEGAGVTACNPNLPVRVLTNDFAADVRKGGANYAQLGFYTQGENVAYSKTPVGFTAANYCQCKPTEAGFKRDWVRTLRVFDNNGDAVQLHDRSCGVVLESILDNGTRCTKAKGEIAEGEAQFKRQLVRDALLHGEELEDSRVSATITTPLMDILKQGGRQYFVIVGDVVGIEESRTAYGDRNWVRCSSIKVLHVTDAVAAFGTERGLNAELSAKAVIQNWG